MALPITTLSPSAIQQDLKSNGLDALGLAGVRLSTRWAGATPTAVDYDAAQLTLNLATLHAPFRGIREFAFSPAASTLAANLAPGDLKLTLAAGSGAKFPSPIAGNVLLTLTNASGSKLEIVSCTARASDVLTIQRAALGSAAQAFNSGDTVTLRLSAGTRTSQFIGADGNPLTGSCTAFRLHPQAILRLQTLVAQRYVAAGAPNNFPIPWAMVVRGAAGFTTAKWFEPDEAMAPLAGAVSFHDGRGLIIDPIYVAALFADLQAFLPGLTMQSPTVAVGGAGGVQVIAALASGTLIHCLDPHGGLYRPALAAATLVTKSAGAVTGAVPATGLVALNGGDGIDTAGNDNGRLRWGFLPNGVLGTSRLVPPAPASPLSRQFYQVAVVDTVWTLLGNRTNATVRGVARDDQKIPGDLLPQIRDNLVINYLVDGPDVLGQAATVLARPAASLFLAVSPTLDGTMAIPTQPGPSADWPAFPAPNTGAAFPSPAASPKDGITAAFTAGNDVVVTIAADKAPDGAHLRIYPAVFVVIAAIAEEPSFIRGDGGAAIAHASAPTQILLANPFALAPGQPRPNPANLTMDIVVAPRTGPRKLFGNVVAPVSAGPAPVPADPFSGGNLVGALPPIFEAIAPVPLFGIPTTVAPPGAAPGGIIGLLRALASETSPRQGPRLPTMARFDTVMITGLPNLPATTLLWEAVLSGGRWARETRSALHASGNPGNPAGPDVHATGVHVTGALAYDLARYAMHRAQPIIPLGAGTPGWVVALDGNNFNPPADTNIALTGVGVLLQTVAAICETPELSPLTPPPPLFTVQSVINNISSALGISPAPTLMLANEARMQREIRREFFVASSGLRDALWSLRRAVREARELIYLESAQFAHTGTVDLVAEIATSLAAHPNLRVLICTPRDADFAPKYKGWARQHYRARAQAVSDLLAVAPDRVAAFHPVGFPGRTALIRTTCVLIDDVWCFSGPTHWRRRGMTLDGSTAIASFDRQMENGYSKKVRIFRRQTMATKLGVAAPGMGTPSGDWLRLGRPESAFQLVADWLAEGGLGAILPLYPGPSDTTVLPATDDMADPDGSNGATFLATFAALIAETGD